MGFSEVVAMRLWQKNLRTFFQTDGILSKSLSRLACSGISLRRAGCAPKLCNSTPGMWERLISVNWDRITMKDGSLSTITAEQFFCWFLRGLAMLRIELLSIDSALFSEIRSSRGELASGKCSWRWLWSWDNLGNRSSFQPSFIYVISKKVMISRYLVTDYI